MHLPRAPLGLYLSHCSVLDVSEVCCCACCAQEAVIEMLSRGYRADGQDGQR